FHGRRGAGRRSAAEALARGLGMSLVCADLERASSPQADLCDSLRLALREARFRDAVVFIEGLDGVRGEDGERQVRRVFDLLNDQPGIVIVSGADADWITAQDVSRFISVAFGVPDAAARRSCWRACLASSRGSLDDGALDTLSQRFRLT